MENEMAQYPALPLWTDSYLADCGHLSDAEHGIYFQILMHMWRSPDCSLPDDDEWLSRKFRRPISDVQSEIRPIINEFCDVRNGRICQLRLNDERERVSSTSKKQSDRAKKRWSKSKPLKTNENGVCHGNADTGNAPISISISNKKETNKEKNATNEQAVNEKFEELWQAYPPERRIAKKKCLDKAEKIVRDGEATWDELIRGAKSYAKERNGQDPQYTAHPMTWLNQERWKAWADDREFVNEDVYKKGMRYYLAATGEEVGKPL